jgi:predicted dehydrogenase
MNSKIIKWGVLSTAKIGIEKVIPAMQKCDNLEIHAISSRNEQNAKKLAKIGDLQI